MRTLASAVLALTTSFGIAKEENIIAHQNVREDLLDSLNEQQILFIDDSLKKNEHQLKKKNAKNLRTSTGSDEYDEETSINHYSPGKEKDHRSHFSNDGVLSNINPPRAQDLDKKDTSKDEVSTEEGAEQDADVGILRVLTGTTAGTTTGVASVVNRRCAGANYGYPYGYPSCYPGTNACYFMGRGAMVINYSCLGMNNECASMLQHADLAGAAFIACHSCLYPYACQYVGQRATGAFNFTITETSCYGNHTCIDMGRNSLFACDFFVDNNSCKGNHACSSLGKGASGSTFTIKDFSCGGFRTCSSVAHNAVNAEVTIHGGSCMGERACEFVGQDITAGATIDIGPDACHGENACVALGRHSNQVSIGANSCKGVSACAATTPAALAPGTIKIGTNACTCDRCCRNLLPGSTVGDGKCISSQENCADQNAPVIV